MVTGRRVSGTLAACLLASPLLLAQAPQNPPPQPQGQRPPTFRVAIDLITTDVIVRDNRGQFIADLKIDEFVLEEDGVPQEIAMMRLIHGGREYAAVDAAPPPPVQEGIILPPPRPTNDAAGRIFLFIVDDLHLDFRNTGRIRQLFKTIEETLVHDGDMWGMVSTGPSSIAIDLTYDRKRFQDAIKRISGAGLRPEEIINGAETAEGPAEVRYRAHVAFSTAYDIMRNFEQIHNRRKAVILVSNGYDFDPFPKARSGEDPLFGGRWGEGNRTNPNPDNPDDPNSQPERLYDQQYRQGQQFSDADLARDLSDLTRAANRANATIYTIDPRGLAGGPDIDDPVDPTEWATHLRKTQDSLRVLAELTGGVAVVNQNDFKKALARIDNETSDYYVLGYYSKNPDPLKRVRRLDVKVKREGVNVWFRTQYALKPR